MERTAAGVDGASAIGIANIGRDVSPPSGDSTGSGSEDGSVAGAAWGVRLAAVLVVAVAIEGAGSATIRGVNVANTGSTNVNGDVGESAGTVSLNGGDGAAGKDRFTAVENTLVAVMIGSTCSESKQAGGDANVQPPRSHSPLTQV